MANNTGQDANDLHIKFDRPVWVRSQKPSAAAQGFKDVAGEGESSGGKIDFGRGTVGKDESLDFTVAWLNDKQRKVKSCTWTKDGKPIGRPCQVKAK